MKYNSGEIQNVLYKSDILDDSDILDEHGYGRRVLGQINENMVDDFYSEVGEAVDGGNVKYGELWDIASEVADHIDKSLTAVDDRDTAEEYSMSSIAALGAVLGAEMNDKGYPKQDLQSEFRVTGPLAAALCAKTGLMNQSSLDLGAYGVSWGEASNLLEETSQIGYENSTAMK